LSAARRGRSDLLVISPNAGSSFVEADVRELGREFEVDRLVFGEFRHKPGFLRELRARLARGGAPVVLLWFLAPAYSLETIALARALRRRVVVAVGGLEVDYVPALRLGGLKWPHNRVRQRIGLRAADLVLSPSDFLAQRIRRLSSPRRLETVYNGIDTDHFTPAGTKERLVLSVCFEINRETAVLKGLPVLVEAARSLPEVPFVVVGRAGGDDTLARLQADAPANVSFTRRFVTDGELLDLYRRAKVYAQLSAHEAFGVAVAESMACRCIPVVAAGHALDEVAGPAARRVPFGDAAEAAAAIEEALRADDAAGDAARGRIVSLYPLSRRTERLTELLRPLLARGIAPRWPDSNQS
jgi:glycosyltransferase involved in cell wall biosynthesis